MKYQTKERKPSQRPNSVLGSVHLAWAPVISKEFLAYIRLPLFQHKPGYFGNTNCSVLRCIVMWPYGFI